ncbi:MAG: MCP four helix bundle domain-containing protein, partial [Pseudolabrys sp.]
MNNWTISRRVIAGFATMLLIIIALGVFALWRLTGLAQNIAGLADSSLPSVLSLEENANLSRDNLIYLERIGTAASAKENAQLEQKIAANKSRVDELMKNYEAQISDDQDRRLFEEIKRTREAMTMARSRATELVNQNKTDEALKLTNEVVIPAYDKFLKA